MRGIVVGEMRLEARRSRGSVVKGLLSALFRQAAASTDPKRLLARITPVQLDRAKLPGHTSSHSQHPRRRIPIRSHRMAPILPDRIWRLELLKKLEVCSLLIGQPRATLGVATVI